MRHAITASRTVPTLCVPVIITGPSRNPDSSIQCVPVISPLPLRLKTPANTGFFERCAPARQDRRNTGSHCVRTCAFDQRRVADGDAVRRR